MRIVGPTQFVLKTSLMKSADVSSIGSSGNQQQMQRRLSFCPATLQGGSAATAGYVRAAPMPALLTKTSTLSTFLASSLAKVEIDVSLAWSRVILCSLSPYSACGIPSMQRPLSTTSWLGLCSAEHTCKSCRCRGVAEELYVATTVQPRASRIFAHPGPIPLLQPEYTSEISFIDEPASGERTVLPPWKVANFAVALLLLPMLGSQPAALRKQRGEPVTTTTAPSSSLRGRPSMSPSAGGAAGAAGGVSLPSAILPLSVASAKHWHCSVTPPLRVRVGVVLRARQRSAVRTYM